MADFMVGTLTASGLSSNLIIQNASVAIESDEQEVKDENGNVAYVQHYNHRAVVNCSAVAAKDAEQPCKGATVSLKGVTLPSPDEDGSMTSATIKLLKDASSGTAVNFLCTSSQLQSSNNDVCQYSLTLTRYLENGIGAIKTSSTTASS